jgi:proline iminopeptidase
MPIGRAEATKVIAEARRIVNSRGIERLETVRIGGIEQWVSIRGTDKRNPVLLLIHGGPGYVSIPMSWWFSRDWEEYFTVVQWDQRGAGKTYLMNDPNSVAPTLTLERMVADTEEMIRWARNELGKEKIFIIGHSWGSYLGLEVAKRHPDWLYAYIGVGQLTNVASRPVAPSAVQPPRAAGGIAPPPFANGAPRREPLPCYCNGPAEMVSVPSTGTVSSCG